MAASVVRILMKVNGDSERVIKTVHLPSELPLTINQDRRSRCSRIIVHDQSEYAGGKQTIYSVVRAHKIYMLWVTFDADGLYRKTPALCSSGCVDNPATLSGTQFDHSKVVFR
jgi:hypothetical protein